MPRARRSPTRRRRAKIHNTEPLTASFEGVPEAHDGQSAFSVRVAFSEEIGISYQTLRDESFTTTGGAVTGARRVDGRHDLWEITVEPSGADNVTITLPRGRDCGTTGAVCTREDERTPRALTNTPSATVKGPSASEGDPPSDPPDPSDPLTASFSGVPGEHTGERFTFGLTFSEDVAGLSYKTLRDAAFSVTNGQVTRARRQTQGTNQGWTITVEPDSPAAVTVTLPAGSVETADGRGLESAVSATVAGPVGIAVADAQVEEAVGAVLAFVVTLERAASGTVTVDYATADGTATAGADYTATSGTLRFAAGETSKTVSVTVLDDAHDDGGETVTLTLSNASGGRLTDGQATGTIKNRDPLPRALLARFGRTAAVHVVEHVEERLQAPREPGFRGRFAGRELRRGDGARDGAELPQPAWWFGRRASARRRRRRTDGRLAGCRHGVARDAGARGRHADGRGGRADGCRVGARRHGGSAGRAPGRTAGSTAADSSRWASAAATC